MNKDRIWILLSRKLSGEATGSELAELELLTAASNTSALAAEVMEEFWNATLENNEEYLEATYHLHLQRLKERGYDLEQTREDAFSNTYLGMEPMPPYNNRKIAWWLAGTLSVLLMTAALYFWWNQPDKVLANRQNNKTALSEVSTKNGSRTKIQLPDGTVVWLNGSSKLNYDYHHFGETLREVSLTGEGYFDVVKNPEKPFIIHTTRMDIRVVGTAFNVRCYPGERNTETSLIRGSIEVTLKDRKEKIMLKPSEKLIVSNTETIDLAGGKKAPSSNRPAKAAIAEPMIALKHLTILPKDSSIVETAWVENRLVFSGERFEDVAFKMEKWYGVDIEFADEPLKNELLTATFEKETVTEALHALQISTRFTYKNSNNMITLSR